MTSTRAPLAGLLLTLLLALLFCLPGAHAQRGGATATAAATAPAAVVPELPQARLAGHGEFTYFGLSIYHASLWVGSQGYQPGAPAAAPFLLELRYARALDGHKIAEASADQMAKIGAGTSAQRQAWLQQMLTIFPDVREGTQISGAYLPGAGVRFYLDGKALAEVHDAAFARAFFAIWLDPASTAKALRVALLRDAAPRP
jgi:hypothetical protein